MQRTVVLTWERIVTGIAFVKKKEHSSVCSYYFTHGRVLSNFCKYNHQLEDENGPRVSPVYYKQARHPVVAGGGIV